MKKFIILALATVISGKSFALEAGTNALAYTLAQTIYTAAIGVATTEASSLATSSKNQKAEAQRIQNEAQIYLESGKTTLFLESKIQVAKDLDSSLSDSEAVDLLIEASSIILK
jgi:hypothetical protein